MKPNVYKTAWRMFSLAIAEKPQWTTAELVGLMSHCLLQAEKQDLEDTADVLKVLSDD